MDAQSREAEAFGRMVRAFERGPVRAPSWPRRAAATAGGFLLALLSLAALAGIIAGLAYVARIGWNLA